ncbi:MAG TPA: aminotransferase class V-fold PLP-dependent enzyme [Tepidisphaeraceae bacterium]|nr:aminotransferase class V-fold PLP-dependent enzyme [Tepidisphaeraceae bacterium]
MNSPNAPRAQPRIYLDHAATSFPKPPGVIEAMVRYQNEIGANAGRGSYLESAEATDLVANCRRKIARLFNAPSSDCIAFTQNCTDALNIAIHGAVQPGQPSHFVCTSMDHNSVVRPINDCVARGAATVTMVRADAQTGRVHADAIRDAIRPETRLVAVPHASNVTGTIQPIESISRVTQSAGVLLLVDAAQTAGHLPIDVQAMGIDLLAAPGHKGLLGPLGTGVLYVCPGVESQIRAFRTGGTGSESESLHHPRVMPHQFEAGSLNLPGIAGLAAAAEWLLSRGVESVRAHEAELVELFERTMPRDRRFHHYGSRELAQRTAVVSFNIEGLAPAEVAMALETHFGILVRSGLHCAAVAHETLNTLSLGGTVRASFGSSTRSDEVGKLIRALGALLG